MLFFFPNFSSCGEISMLNTQKKCIWTFGSKSLNAHDYVTTLNENVWMALNGAFPIIYDLWHSLTWYAKVFECKVKSLNASDYIITFNGIIWTALNGAFPLYMICRILWQGPFSSCDWWQRILWNHPKKIVGGMSWRLVGIAAEMATSHQG